MRRWEVTMTTATRWPFASRRTAEHGIHPFLKQAKD
jgi:hypothetical protein